MQGHLWQKLKGRPRKPNVLEEKPEHSTLKRYSCRRCGEKYPRHGDYFYAAKQYRDGLDIYCVLCRRVIRREWYRKNHAKCITQNQTPAAKFQGYKNGARQRGMAFSLTIDDFMELWQAPCAYCGAEIPTIGIDRIDSKKGYFRENMVSCCELCNRMKQHLSVSTWLEHVKKIVANNH
jgi:hypothetical protein